MTLIYVQIEFPRGYSEKRRGWPDALLCDSMLFRLNAGN